MAVTNKGQDNGEAMALVGASLTLIVSRRPKLSELFWTEPFGEDVAIKVLRQHSGCFAGAVENFGPTELWKFVVGSGDLKGD